MQRSNLSSGALSSASSSVHATTPAPMLSSSLSQASMSTPLTCGYLDKLSIGRSRIFHRTNWKRRYFVLRRSVLEYYDREGGVLKGTIGLDINTTVQMRATREVHPSACDEGFMYLAVCFHEQGVKRMLLVRTAVAEECDMWGVAVMNGIRAVQEEEGGFS
eukprot:PhM_4_TR18625/c3_g1_i1/m.27279